MKPRKSNLLFIMTDQQRFDTLGVNGNRNMKTPELDRLAESGANVQGYHTNAPVCVPSRCSLFTGRYLHSHHCRENYCFLEAGREFHLFRVLKQEGYRLGYSGKNHLIDDQEKENFEMFDDEQTAPELELAARHKEWAWRPENRGNGRSEIWREGMVHDGPPEATRTWRTAERAIGFLDQQNADEPFVLCVSFEDPHVPHLALREYFEKYPLDEIDLLPFEGEEGLAEKARRWAMKYNAFNAAAATGQDKKRYIAIYRAMISWIDTQVGRILAKLDAKGLRENTLVVFTSDHGDFNFEHGLAKKDLVLCDSLLRVPCLFSFPGRIDPGVIGGTFVEEVDILPTILELLDVETPVGVQGRSCAGLLKGATTCHKDVTFSEVCPPYLYNKYPDFDAFAAEHGGRGNTPFNVPGDFTKSIREDDWRYVWYGTGEEELYDHRSDPHELHNLAADPAYAAEKTRLKLRLLEWHALTEDPLDSNLRRDLQARYPDWTPLTIQPGHYYSPPWKETLHMALAKPV